MSALLVAVSANAATLTVNSTADDGDGTCTSSKCTLRDAILSAALSGDAITFSLPANSAITLTNGQLLVDKNLAINGPGANLLTVQRSAASGKPLFRIFSISSNVDVTISRLTIANGQPPVGSGGGIENEGTVTITNSTVSGNSTSSSGNGGAIYNGHTATITNSTISGNSTSSGGGIYNSNGSTVTITNSTISGNSASGVLIGGGGIYNSDGGTVIITNSTISGNSTSGHDDTRGGGIWNDSTGTVTTITNSTISGNSASGGPGHSGSGGGIYSLSNTVRSRNNIIAKNTADIGPDVFGALNSQGYNLIGDNQNATITGTTGDQIGAHASPINPMLGSLWDNGGPTFTQALLPGSPAIDKGHSSGSNTDQRGFTRPIDTPAIVNVNGGDGGDIGAYEVQPDHLVGCGNTVVANSSDSDADSLRAVVANACEGSTITFASNVRGAINLTSGELLINKSLTINGPGANLLSVQRSPASGTPNFRIFEIAPASVNATISGLTISNGNAFGPRGGGIRSNGTLNIANCAISGNLADNGGGLYNDFGTLTLTNSTISGNTVSSTFNAGSGGGIFNQGGTVALSSSTVSGNTAIGPGGNSDSGGGIITNVGTVTLTNSTISGNSGDLGGGIRNVNGGTVRSRNTIIALNTSPSGPDFNGALTSQGFNLIGDNTGATITPADSTDQIGVTAVQLNLAPLQYNGGPTQTHALLAGSFALDKGNASGLSTDQRGVGYARTIDDPGITNVAGGDGSDIGAFEFGGKLSVVSRKTHGATNFDIDLPLTGATIGIECRRNTGADISGPNAGRDHELIVTFPSAVTVGGASVTSNDATDTPTATSSVGSNIVTVDLHNIPNARRLTINLASVSDGTTTNNVSVPMGVLVGDTTGDGNVNSGDIAQTKSKSGQTVAASNFRADLTVDGNLNSGDIALAKSKSGTALPP